VAIIPVTTADKVLYDSTTGLLPFVQSRMAADYAKWQVKSYSFGTDPTTGFRVRDGRTRYEGNQRITTESVIFGASIQATAITGETILAARTLRDNLIEAIHEWSKCKCPALLMPVDEFNHSISHETLQGVPSGTSRAFWTVVLVRFDIEFKE
jgi:hypothetical protein